MATVLKVIQDAWRRSGVVGMGVVINAKQKEVGLERLQDMLTNMAESMFGSITDKYLTSADNYTAAEFERVINTQDATVSLPATVLDCLSGDTRPPIDGCVIVLVDPGTSSHTNIYDAAMGEWQQIDGLVINSQCPLTTRWKEGITNLLAVMLADDVGVPIGPVLAKNAGSARLSIASRYGSVRAPAKNEYF